MKILIVDDMDIVELLKRAAHIECHRKFWKDMNFCPEYKKQYDVRKNIKMGQCPVKLSNEQLLHLIECRRIGRTASL